MKIGNSVKVKKGIKSPDCDDLLIEGWQGRIVEIDGNIITIELDSITLGNLSKDYIIESIIEELEFTLLCLEIDEVELSTSRDTKEDTLSKQNNLNSRYSCDEEEKRIFEVLNFGDLSVNNENIEKYYNFLNEKIQLPCILTGREDFDWEESYVFDNCNNEEYDRLKKDKPSYTDSFEFISLNHDLDDYKGIYANVKRLSDSKLFLIPLWDLEVLDDNDPNFLIISDYSFWMTNH